MNSDFAALERVGLNLQAIFDAGALPDALRAAIPEEPGAPPYRQLILIGNAGSGLWEAIVKSGIGGEGPIDAFSVAAVDAWFASRFGALRRKILYPGPGFIDLQALGALAGWHHPSPLMLGIHPRWGTWFAYRVALVADTALAVSTPECSKPPCDSCELRPCIEACPAGAVAPGGLSLERCIAFRRQKGSICAADCPARRRCPAGARHRYCDEQIHYSYANSLRAIERYQR